MSILGRNSVDKAGEEIRRDLEKFRKMAIELGATDAKIITSDMVVIDERVYAKCIWPKCEHYGTNINCPPYTMGPDQMRNLVKRYRYGIFLRVEVPPELVAGSGAKTAAYKPYGMKRHEIVAKIEAEAFYDGHPYALGFAGGPCKLYFCPNVECSALKPRHACRHPLKARSAMEAVGMDVFAMAKKAGWKIYPIGARTQSHEIPYGAFHGLVLIC